MKRKMIPVRSRADVPHFANDAEAAEFWDTHELTEEYLRGASIARERGPAARIESARDKTDPPVNRERHV